MRVRSVALTLIGPLAVTLAVAAPATAAIVAAGPTAVPTSTGAAATHPTMSHSMSAEDMAAMTHSSVVPTGKHAVVSTYHRSGTQGLPKIKGEVGPGFTISINKASVPAGKYKFIVNDLGTSHNFHLTGAGVDEKTGVPETGKVTWKVKLEAGTYTAVCDPHSSSMKTSLKVT